jgi:hypothetical protein
MMHGRKRRRHKDKRELTLGAKDGSDEAEVAGCDKTEKEGDEAELEGFTKITGRRRTTALGGGHGGDCGYAARPSMRARGNEGVDE